MDDAPLENRARDATSLRLLGSFFCILGLLLFVGVWWSRDDGRAIIVSLASSGVILAVGVGMLLGARRLRRQAGTEFTTKITKATKEDL